MSAAKRNAPAGGTARGANGEQSESPKDEYSSRPNIVVNEASLSTNTEQVLEILGRIDPPIFFRRGTSLSMVIDPPAQSETRDRSAPSVISVTAPTVRVGMGRAARFMKWDGRHQEFKEIDCPMPLANALVAPGDRHPVPELTGLAEAPVLLPSGRIIEEVGYNRETGIYLTGAPRGGFNVTRGEHVDPQEALAYILDLAKDFEFRTDADRSALIASWINPLVSPGIPSTPVSVYSAEAPGVGKSTAVRCAGVVGMGRDIPVIGWAKDEAENEKRAGGVLQAAPPMASIDNIESVLGGAWLCSFSSESKVLHRELGNSAMHEIPARVAWYANGNNLVIKGDLTRRVVVCRLYSGVERPEQRTFDRDIVPHMLQHRKEVIRNLLAIPRAYLAAGCPDVGTTAFGSFGDWDRLVRRPLIWMGLPDPLEPAEELRASDPEREELRALLQAWHAHFGREPQTAAEVIRAATDTVHRLDGSAADDAPELAEAVAGVCTTRSGPKLDARTLGYALRRHCDRIESGLRLEKAGNARTNTVRWQVVEV